MLVFQNQVGASSDDHAVALRSQLFDELFLRRHNLYGLKPDVVGGNDMLADGRRIKQQNILFGRMGDIVPVHVFLLRDHVNGLLVIARNAQRVRKPFSKFPPTAAEFPTDRNNSHNFPSN